MLGQSAMWMVSVFCYPFLVTSAFVLSNSATAFTAGRLAAALLYNLAFSLTVACILRLGRPRLPPRRGQCFLALLALFTFVSVVHFPLVRPAPWAAIDLCAAGYDPDR